MKGSRNSVSSLHVLLAASRQLNFSRTAEALHMSQSAVSKHIQAIEERLGVPLFERSPTGLRLNSAGALYVEKVAAALHLLEEADALVVQPNAFVNLNIAVAPTFAQLCLIPQLQLFHDEFPGTRVNIRPRLVAGREQSERFDAEIQLNTGHAAGMTGHYLCGHEMGLVAAPQLLARCPIAAVDDLDHVPMLKRMQPGYSWEEWLAQVAPGRSSPGPRAPEYEGFSVLLPAVVHGLGVAIVPLCLVQQQLRSGQLLRPLNDRVHGRYGYHLMLPRPSHSGPGLDAFCSWLAAMAVELEPGQQA